jgi:hypothetical protein
VFLWSCRDERPSTFDRNLPPETVISGAPAESTLSYYRVHLFWHGTDPDGLVDHYEYSVTDSNKTPGEDDIGFSGYFSTTLTDSLFVLTADQPQILGHRFYVRAVDNEGKVDPSPAWAYFIAHDFHFPNVEFTSAVGTWTDRSGNQRTRPINSSSRFNATDTIGVGGTVSFAWTGFDVDPGGFIVGFEHRSSQDNEFMGGTLGDTTATVSYDLPAGSNLSSYFSGNEALFVRAIDDAGAKTNPDSIRSYVVNFGPVVWIVDPNQVSPPVRKLVFTDTNTQNIWPSGTTLADGAPRFIQFKYTGFDDPRDMSLDPSNPTGIIGFSFRRLKNGGGVAFKDIDDWKSFPEVSDFIDNSALITGNYVYLIRGTDELGRSGKPETLRVNINYSPFFRSVNYVVQDTLESPLWIPRPGGISTDTVTVTIPQEPGGGYPDFHIRFLADDIHSPPPGQDVLDFNDVVEQELGRVTEYSLRLNNSRVGFESAPVDTAGLPMPDDRFFPVSTERGNGVVSNGLNTVDIRARDFSGRITPLVFFFRAILE